jgi:hypothetical protein
MKNAFNLGGGRRRRAQYATLTSYLDLDCADCMQLSTQMKKSPIQSVYTDCQIEKTKANGFSFRLQIATTLWLSVGIFSNNHATYWNYHYMGIHPKVPGSD